MLVLVTKAVAKIGLGAAINQTSSYQTDTQSVKVSADILANIFNVTGNFNLDLQPVTAAGGNGLLDSYKNKLLNKIENLKK